jgi:hypothetical protein
VKEKKLVSFDSFQKLKNFKSLVCRLGMYASTNEASLLLLLLFIDCSVADTENFPDLLLSFDSYLEENKKASHLFFFLLIVLLQSEKFFQSCFSLLIPVLKKTKKNLSSPTVLFTR